MPFSNKYLVSAVVLVAAGAAVYGLTMQPEIARPGQAFEIQDSAHIPPNAPTPAYSTNPPTSGPHASHVPGGFYPAGIKDIFAVHNLEHGFIWVTYKGVDGETVAKLKKLGQRFSGSVVVSLRIANDSPIAVSSWGRQMKMDTYDEAAILDFIEKNKNQSPERLAR